MLKRTYVSTIVPVTSAAEFLSIRAAWGGQDRLAPPAVPRGAVLRHVGLPGIHGVAPGAASVAGRLDQEYQYDREPYRQLLAVVHKGNVRYRTSRTGSK